MIILLWSSLAAARPSAKDGDPCGDYKGEYGTPYRFADPYNCKKYWMCVYDLDHSSGSLTNFSSHITCPAGTSFTPDLNDPCNGPPPYKVGRKCWKSKGLEE